MAESVATTSRVWSCATLQDGLCFVADEAAQLEKEELELERQIKAPKNHIHNMPLNYEINHQIERHSALSEFPFTKGLGFIQLYKSGSSGIESHISCLSTMHLYNAGDGDGGTLPAEIFC